MIILMVTLSNSQLSHILQLYLFCACGGHSVILLLCAGSGEHGTHSVEVNNTVKKMCLIISNEVVFGSAQGGGHAHFAVSLGCRQEVQHFLLRFKSAGPRCHLFFIPDGVQMADPAGTLLTGENGNHVSVLLASDTHRSPERERL